MSSFDDLRELGRMLDEGKITQSEYDLVKADLLADMAEESSSETPGHTPGSPSRDEELHRSSLPRSPVQWAIAILALVLGAYFTYSWLADDEPPAMAESQAHELAIADTGNDNPSDLTISQYEAALAELEDTCRLEPGQTHADLALGASQLLADDGVQLSALQMLRAMAEAGDEMRSNDVECSGAYATVAVLILQDQ